MSESPSRIEPTRLEHPSEAVLNVLADLTAAAASFGAALHPRTSGHLADLVRIMNTYYSNLIEGHDAHPIDIPVRPRRCTRRAPSRSTMAAVRRAHPACVSRIPSIASPASIGPNPIRVMSVAASRSSDPSMTAP